MNVVILRAFSGESIVLPPSKCPTCQNRLKWWHNIPIISYALLRGKCYFCKEHISVQYPIIEFVTGLLFVLMFLKYQMSIETLFASVIVSLLIVISVTDIKEKVVFDAHTYSLIGVGLVYSIYRTVIGIVNANNFSFSTEWLLSNPLTLSLAGILVGVIVMELVAKIGYLFTNSRAFGEGDTYIAAGLGAILGGKLILITLVLSVIVQLIFTLPLFIKKLFNKKEWDVLIPLTLFTILVIVHCISGNNSSLIFSLALMGVGIWSCVKIIQGIKNPDTMTYLPFGPAMAVAGLIVLLLIV